MCTLKGYFPCHNEEEVVADCGYDPEADLENPTGSVFCAHGAGFVVPWYEVKDYMQVESPLKVSEKGLEAGENKENSRKPLGAGTGIGIARNSGNSSQNFGADEKELEAIFTRTYGEKRRRLPGESGPRLVTFDPKKQGEASYGPDPDPESRKSGIYEETAGTGGGISSGGWL